MIYLIPFVLVLGLMLTSVAKSDLIGWWRFEEGSGNTAYDSSGNGHDGTLNGNPEWAIGPPGFGGALAFHPDKCTGIDCGIFDPTNGTGQFTVALWAFWDGTGTYQHFITKSAEWGADTMMFQFELWGAHTDASYTDRVGVSYEPAGSVAFFIMPKNEWVHLALTFDGTNAVIYLNGVDEEGPKPFAIGPDIDAQVEIGYTSTRPSGIERTFEGRLDEVRVYDRALTQEEIEFVMEGGEGYPYALGPVPADGALYPDTWVSLSWSPGDYAVSHDVYLGDKFDDVNEGTGDTFRGNQTETFLVVGFPGFPYPDGLVPGTTYYWRIDEVNDADPNSPWKGNVWSFSVPPRTAYNPEPADGAKFIGPDVILSWTPGFGAKLHTMYFGDDFDNVNNATGGATIGIAAYTPGPLELDKKYYWRVDEFDAITTHKGDVWSFTTAGAGGGAKAEYFKGMDLRNLVLTRTDPQINFNWGSGEPDPLVGADSFSVRWIGEVEAAFTETYTFYTNSDDGVRLWVDGQQLVDNWIDHSATENSGKIDLIAGQTYSIQMEYYENGGDAVAELRWSSPHTPKQLIPQAALSPPIKAGSPNPANGATGIKHTATLSWKPGDDAASHQVYFGTDADAVRNATTASPEYKGSKALGSESYDPGKLAWFTTYYWRVDEVNNVHPDSPWVGNLWSFTTGDFLVVDDFELYNDINPGEEGSNRIFLTWIDGYDTPTNGSQVGYTDPPFCEQTIVHSGRQSMPLFYDNSGPAYYSEATLPLSDTRDWTEEGVKILTLWFYGDPANVAESMYVAVANATGPTAVVYHDNADAVLIDDWTQWNIDLEEFSNAGVVLTNVDRLAIGFGNRNNPQLGGSGMVFIDDIRLYRPAP